MTLLLGGARSGKSTLAARLATEWDGPVTVIATAEALDDEMEARIARHRAERPKHWTVVEEPRALAGALERLRDDCCAVVDCLTLWVSNLIEEFSDDEIEAQAREAARIAGARRAPTIVVSNEVGSGIVPANELARRYGDLLGRVNSLWAQEAGRSALVVAGRVLLLSDSESLIDGRAR